MSGCQCINGCDYDDGDGDVVLLKNGQRLRAGKPHTCGCCRRIIPRGADFFFTQTREISTKKIYSFYECLGCADLAGHFWCEDGYAPFSNRTDILAEGLADQEAEGQESVCCYDGLTPAALEVLEEVVWPEVEKILPARREWAVRIAEEIRRASATPAPAPTADQ